MHKAIFYHITTGKFIKKSAIFHAQILRKRNRVLKMKCTTGKINFYKACSIIHSFKVDSLRKFHSSMWLEDMNPRKLSSVQRERKILEIMEIFCEENNFDDPVHLCHFAVNNCCKNYSALIIYYKIYITRL